MKKLALLILALALVGGLFWFFLKTGNLSGEQEAAPNLQPEVADGKIILKSFQNGDAKVGRAAPISVPVPKNTLKTTEESALAPKVSETEIVLNNVSLLWLNQVHAVRAEEDAPGAQNGFQIIKEPPTQKAFGEFQRSSLFVVTDKKHLEQKVVTGGVVVELKESTSAAEMAQSLGMELRYELPQIKAAVFQAQEGQDLMQKIEQLKSMPQVKTARLELLGKGLKPK